MSFEGFDLDSFWEHSEYAERKYVSEPLTPALVAAIEQSLGYRLPAAYVELMRHQNGGVPVRTNHRTTAPTSWAEDHVAITGIFGVGNQKSYSLGGKFGSRFWIEDWQYPAVGVYFANCPSAGHDMLCLDYRACGPQGEPSVVHVDQEFDYAITAVAGSFEAFVRGLEADDAFPT